MACLDQRMQDQLAAEVVGAEPAGDGDRWSHGIVAPRHGGQPALRRGGPVLQDAPVDSLLPAGV